MKFLSAVGRLRTKYCTHTHTHTHMEETKNKHEQTKSTRCDNLLFNKPKSNLYYKCQLITENWLTLGYTSSHQALSAEMLWKGKEMRILALREQILKGACGEHGVIRNKQDPFWLWHSSCNLVFFFPWLTNT